MMTHGELHRMARRHASRPTTVQRAHGTAADTAREWDRSPRRQQHGVITIAERSVAHFTRAPALGTDRGIGAMPWRASQPARGHRSGRPSPGITETPQTIAAPDRLMASRPKPTCENLWFMPVASGYPTAVGKPAPAARTRLSGGLTRVGDVPATGTPALRMAGGPLAEQAPGAWMCKKRTPMRRRQGTATTATARRPANREAC